MESAPFAFVKPQAHSSQSKKTTRTHGGGGKDSTLNAMRRSQLSRTRSETRIFGQVQGFQKPKLNDVPLSSAKITQFKAMEERGSSDLQYQFERMAREKAQLSVDHDNLVQQYADLSEEVERLSIQCDVWRSKFLGSRTQVSQLIDLRNAIYQQFGKAQAAIDNVMKERAPIRKEMVETYRLLDQLVKALRWGKPQPLQQAANPRNMKELVQANHRLVSAVSAQLLGNIKPMNSANQETVESGIGLTNAEAAATQVLNMNFDLQLLSPESAAPVGKMSGRFHPQHKYEEITVNCCNKCKGEIKVV
ncbi:PREDICTED: golgin-45-like [Branchiostoma belcheri]|uniref:Golgin-45-like n=1 Tax=Branchiostoma belcheri TaxID=7741 RepID=A0A6P4ZCE0_BRABE|nr:PREDICTED: golgin-45-like [Branchiostoma belcheri]